MFQIGSEFVMRTLVVYGLAFVACLLMTTAQAQDCYIDPVTGQQVCPLRTPVRSVVATVIPNSWEVSSSPVRSVIAHSVPDSWEMPVAGYSVSSTQSYGSTGSVTYGAGGSTGSVVQGYSVGSTGGYSVSSYGSTGSVVQSQSYGSTGSVQSYDSTSSVQSYGSAGSAVCDLPVRTPVRNLINALRPANQPVRKVMQALRPVSYVPSTNYSDTTYGFAATLNASGGLFHDNSYNGAEVVYRSSGVATEEAARRSWMRSPGHRRLLLAGKISNIVCVGNVCVGR
jgi:hypothetical protein